MRYEKPEIHDFGPIVEHTYLQVPPYSGGPSGDDTDGSVDNDA
ncbi:MAG: hypothetical protein OEM84_11240 [Acidimicrobiia bacterium]|nr:hypothetical protein [Acidimicrobiia bacterium]